MDQGFAVTKDGEALLDRLAELHGKELSVRGDDAEEIVFFLRSDGGDDQRCILMEEHHFGGRTGGIADLNADADLAGEAVLGQCDGKAAVGDIIDGLHGGCLRQFSEGAMEGGLVIKVERGNIAPEMGEALARVFCSAEGVQGVADGSGDRFAADQIDEIAGALEVRGDGFGYVVENADDADDGRGVDAFATGLVI